FKPQTDDVREATSRVVIEGLWQRGAKVQAYDPEAMEEIQRIYGSRDDLRLCGTKEAALEGADALIICTEWKHFWAPDFKQLHDKLGDRAIFDGRNIYDPHKIKELGFAYYKKSLHAQAVPRLKRALEENPADKEVVQLLGLSYYLTGKPAQAIPLLEQVHSWYAVANVDASYVLGLCYIQIKDYEQARKAFASMYDVPPDSAASHLFLARMLLRQEYDPRAEEQARKAAELNPNLPLAHFLLGELYMYKSRIPEAIEEFEKELAVNPSHAATYYKLADAYSRIMKFEQAQRLLQRSIWLDSTASGPYVLMGKVLLKKGEAQLALRALQRALQMDPNNVMGHQLLGQTYRELGQTEEAERELRLAQQLRAAQNPKP
ncbi:MAG: tetratricopeptide repeat protein, partial [Acidobacteria bacterium]|nr:tetratricopeptide repeat protein [Acidobacteriota bacterium]